MPRRVLTLATLALSKIIGQPLLSGLKSICVLTSNSDLNIDRIAPSDSQEEILPQNIDCISDHGGTISEEIPDSFKLSEFRSSWDAPLVNWPDQHSTSADSNRVSDDSEEDIIFPEVTISAVTETRQAESSIEVPNQRSYTGRKPVISSSLADIPCATLGVQGVLDKLKDTLGTSHTLDTRSLSSVLEDYILKNYDFGTAYGRLRQVWNRNDDSNIQDELLRHEENDREMRQKALVGNWIVDTYLPPRHVWDLYSNRVVPWWNVGIWPQPISHAWVDEKDRVDVWTPINGKEWPVPIPKGASPNQIRIEMLNLGAEYTWLDVVCLRQKGGQREDLRAEEWKLDVPTIGRVYSMGKVVIYASGLGLPLSLKEGDLDSDRCWFRRAWTLQEGRWDRIMAGDTPDGPMHAKPIDDHENYETEILTRFHREVKSMEDWRRGHIFSALRRMQNRMSTNPVDKVVGLAFLLRLETIPAYHESESLEDVWTAMVNATCIDGRLLLLFLYPKAGLGCKKWRPTWAQVMTEPLPTYGISCSGGVERDDETDEDWFEGPCIEKGHVRGLDGSAERDDLREIRGELVVEGADGMAHTFPIHVNHRYPIPEDTYVLLGVRAAFSDSSTPCQWVVGRRLPDQRFEKVSVFGIYSGERLQDLGITVYSRHILV
ncbi:uncharacterized protein ARMOST_18489 [Armillaria ostoyae]|uniref:Heterokaryon incompatibility domain-containing protein n=1 Tax=Armillaria ostoyae TaxID=47428 RepID=A0A284S1X9_ARMOS|nr:uncharacterized protein ARMOST_18489 [Armillaria ostoyae]